MSENNPQTVSKVPVRETLSNAGATDNGARGETKLREAAGEPGTAAEAAGTEASSGHSDTADSGNEKPGIVALSETQTADDKGAATTEAQVTPAATEKRDSVETPGTNSEQDQAADTPHTGVGFLKAAANLLSGLGWPTKPLPEPVQVQVQPVTKVEPARPRRRDRSHLLRWDTKDMRRARKGLIKSAWRASLYDQPYVYGSAFQQMCDKLFYEIRDIPGVESVDLRFLNQRGAAENVLRSWRYGPPNEFDEAGWPQLTVFLESSDPQQAEIPLLFEACRIRLIERCAAAKSVPATPAKQPNPVDRNAYYNSFYRTKRIELFEQVKNIPGVLDVEVKGDTLVVIVEFASEEQTKIPKRFGTCNVYKEFADRRTPAQRSYRPPFNQGGYVVRFPSQQYWRPPLDEPAVKEQEPVDVSSMLFDADEQNAAGERAESVEPCPDCSESCPIDRDGYCTSCGAQRGAPKRDHVEVVVSVKAAGVTDVGCQKGDNEDNLALMQVELPIAGKTAEGTVAVVCDGISQSQNPKEAAKLGSNTVRKVLLAAVRNVGAKQAMQAAIAQASAVVRLIPSVAGHSVGPADSTVVAALKIGGNITLGWLGDSRAYFVSSSSTRRLTRDHSWVNAMVDTGKMTEEEARKNADMACAVVRSLAAPGADANGVCGIADFRIEEQGWLLLCSDGFSYYAPDEKIAALIGELPAEANALAVAHHLVEHARNAGGHDNITVIAIRCDVASQHDEEFTCN
jgi:serine/threonine protein phosphatase PrpC